MAEEVFANTKRHKTGDVAYALGCNLSEEGVTFESKIQNSFEQKDRIALLNIIQGNVLCNRIYPIIFKESSERWAHLRSISFLQELVTDWTRYETLTQEETQIFRIGLRDFYSASYLGLLSDEEKQLVRKVIELTPDESNREH
jgi:hypothetical protein